MLTFAELADFLKKSQRRVRPELEAVMQVEMEAAAEISRGFIGEDYWNPGWAPLSPSTIEDKARQGYETPKPLLRTGRLRKSVTGHAEPTAEGVKGAVQSNDPDAVFHEFGTSRMPPRPFLQPALIRAAPSITHALGGLAGRLLVPGHRND